MTPLEFPNDPTPNAPTRQLFALNPLWNEAKILERLIYRSRNQHRSTRYFKLSQHVQRLLKRLARLVHWLELVYNRRKGSFIYLAYINQGIKLLEEVLRPVLRRLFLIVYEQNQKGYFGAMMRMLIGMSARMDFLVCELTPQFKLLYDCCWEECSEEVREECKELPKGNPLPPDAARIKAGEKHDPPKFWVATRETLPVKRTAPEDTKKAKKPFIKTRQLPSSQVIPQPTHTRFSNTPSLDDIDNIFKGLVD